MTQLPQLCLGTVQFGIPYGITNQGGQVTQDEVRRILNLASASGITFFDTAQAYGNAETILGQNWPIEAPRRLISKLPAGAPPHSWEESLMSSLRRLQISKLDSLLLHRAADLLEPNGKALLDWLESARDRGLVDRIGVSIYQASDLVSLPLDRLQLVQLPLSVYDQRLIRDNTVYRLQDQGIAVHVRTVLLQGLLVQVPSQWPNHFSQSFLNHHAQWIHYLQQQKLSPLAGALGFVRAYEGIEAILFGVLSREELVQILQAWSEAESVNPRLGLGWAWETNSDLDPRCWPPR